MREIFPGKYVTCTQQIGICDNQQKKFHFSAVHVSSACLKIRNTIIQTSHSFSQFFGHLLLCIVPSGSVLICLPGFLVLSYKIGRFFTPSINFSTSIKQIINLSNYVIYQSISRLWMNYEYSCDKSAISLINTHFCRPLSSDAGRCRTSKCRSNRTKLNIDDSDVATTHDVVLYVNSVA